MIWKSKLFLYILHKGVKFCRYSVLGSVLAENVVKKDHFFSRLSDWLWDCQAKKFEPSPLLSQFVPTVLSLRLHDELSDKGSLLWRIWDGWAVRIKGNSNWQRRICDHLHRSHNLHGLIIDEIWRLASRVNLTIMESSLNVLKEMFRS